MKIRTIIRKREPLNMLWDRIQLDRRIRAAAAKLPANKNKDKSPLLAFVQDSHSS